MAAPNTIKADNSLIGEITKRIVDRFHPKRVVLFGSYARGDARPDSDLDLMIEMETDLPPASRIRAIDALFMDRTWPMDLVVFTPQEVRANRNMRGTLLYSIEREGKVLYGS